MHRVSTFEFYKLHGLWRVAIRYDDDLEEDRPATQFELHLRDQAPRPEASLISETSITLAEAINEPCKGCGKRPIEFMEGT